MAWTAPMTAVPNTIWYASQFNKFIRDNLKETMPGKATAEGRYFVPHYKKPNSLVERAISEHTIATSQTTSSTSYTNLATVGPTITVTTGPTAMVFFSAQLSNNTANTQSVASVAVTGASNQPATPNKMILNDGSPANDANRSSSFSWFFDLKPGINTFTMKYKVGGGTGTFSNRHLVVMPLT